MKRNNIMLSLVVRIMKVLALNINAKYLGDGDSSAFKTVSER